MNGAAPSLGRHLAWITGAALLTGLVLWWPSQALAGRASLPGLAWAGGIVWAGACLGRVVTGWVSRRIPGPQGLVSANLAGIGARLLATLAGVLPIVASKPFALLPFGLQAMGFYAVLLGLEVVVNSRALGQNPPPGGSAGPGRDSAASQSGPLPSDPSA